MGRYLKEKNPKVKIVGVDPVGSIFHDFFHHKRLIKPKVYQIEGIGEDYLVKAIDFDVIDDIVQVNDTESFSEARRLAQQEGILCGGSSGSAVCGALKIANKFPDKNIVILLPDSGNMYLSKFLNDEWMLSHGHQVYARESVLAVPKFEE